jgi:hypothetical protein
MALEELQLSAIAQAPVEFDEARAQNAILNGIRELGVRYRGVTKDRYLSFERLDKSEPLNKKRAMEWARKIAETIRNLSDEPDAVAFLEAHRGLKIA